MLEKEIVIYDNNKYYRFELIRLFNGHYNYIITNKEGMLSISIDEIENYIKYNKKYYYLKYPYIKKFLNYCKFKYQLETLIYE